MSTWGSYPKIHSLGHAAVRELLLDDVLVEEKVDGSQFSFGRFLENGELVLRVRSKGCEIVLDAPPKMFERAVEVVRSIEVNLNVGWTYRAEYLSRPKHNVLVYDRVPLNNLMLFDVESDIEQYLSYDEKVAEARILGIEVVPCLYRGKLSSPADLRLLFETVSVLGGQKIEGVVVKNYSRFGRDGHVLLGKFVSEAFKETHKGEWRESNPTSGDVVQRLIEALRTPARWSKAVQHLRESERLDGSPKDIGPLIKEVQNDIEAEETQYIKEQLFKYAMPHIRRGVISGLPEWYKDQLLQQQFEPGIADEVREPDEETAL